jgi:2'-5' RNA ligase
MAKRAQDLYFLAVIPDDAICKEVMQFKQDVSDKFNSKAALKSPPHITLHMPFKWRADREKKLLDTLSEFSFKGYPFPVQLDGFGFFEPRVVFVNVEKSDALTQLQVQLSQFIRRELKILNAEYKNRGFHPHMTIAFRDLKKAVFPVAKSHYESKDFQQSFEANCFWLLKHDGIKWHTYKKFS